MIIISVDGRKATLVSRGELIQGNVDTIEVDFQIADGDSSEIWNGAVVAAVFKIVTPLGEAKYSTSLIDYATGVVRIPRIPMAYENAKLKAGMRGVFENGNVVATNMVDVGTVIEGAGGEEFDRSMNEAWQDNAAVDDFLEEIARMVHRHPNKAALDEVTADLIADVADNTASRHTHSNKATLDSLYYYDAEHPPADNDPDDPIQMPSIDPDTSGRYLRAGDKYLRKTEDGGVIARVITITKSGKKYLRFTFNWDPDLWLDLEAGNSVAGRPMYVDIPVEEVNSQQGGNTLELDLGVNSISEEIIGIQEDLSVLPDWNENDPTKRAHITNRTHWAEIVTVSEEYTVEWADEQPPYSPQNWDSINLGIHLYEGVEYTLVADGQTITGECTKIEVQTPTGSQVHLILGNLYYLNGITPSGETYEDNGFPILLDFATEYTDSSVSFNLVLTSQDYFGSDLLFSLEKEETVYHPLSVDYMPDSARDAVELKHTHQNKAVLDQLAFASIGGTSLLTYDNRLTGLPPIRNENDPFTGAITPHVLHRFGNGLANPISSLTITGLSTSNAHAGLAAEYLIEFVTGATAPTVTFPASVEWVDELTVEANKHYQISILDNVALWCAVDVEAVNE